MKRQNAIITIAFVAVIFLGATSILGQNYSAASPKAERVLIEQSFEYFGNKHYSKAVGKLTEAIRLNPDREHYYAYRGWMYLEMGMLDEAIADLTKAISLNPDNKMGLVYYNRGRSYLKRGRNRLAIADFSKDLESFPGFPLGYYHRGIAYLREGELNKAIADFDRTIELNPRNRQAVYLREISYSKLRFRKFKQKRRSAAARRPM